MRMTYLIFINNILNKQVYQIAKIRLILAHNSSSLTFLQACLMESKKKTKIFKISSCLLYHNPKKQTSHIEIINSKIISKELLVL